MERERRRAAAQNPGQYVADGNRADGAVTLGSDEVAIQPPVGVDRISRDAGFPGILFLEMRASVEVVADGMQRHRGAILE